MKEIKEEVKTINARCNIQPKQCAVEFMTREAFKLQFDALVKSWEEDRRRFRWSIGTILVVVNIVVSIIMNILTKG
jgi:hypothetical protein